jgi:predicted small lipoprotein YifL
VIGLALSLATCGKKAPLRLPEDRPAEKAPAPRARVREGRVTLDFRVPRHRLFPEREEPWILARILRQTAPSPEVVEAGAILEGGGFAFDSPLVWSDQELPPKAVYAYRVEFRDATRRRALSEPLTVSWDEVPEAPSGLTAVGSARAIILTWAAPGRASAGMRYRLYRRVSPQTAWEPVSPAPITESRFVDTMIETDRGYCYTVRAVLDGRGLEIEGPAVAESCSRAAEETLPPARPPGAAP